MSTTTLAEHTVTVAGKPIFVAEAGSGAPVVMLHGGGPGASGVSNYSRNIDALAEHFRVIVSDMPGYGRSAKGIDQSDPFRATRSPHREPLGAAWGRSADQHAVAAIQPKRDRARTAPFHEANVKP